MTISSTIVPLLSHHETSRHAVDIDLVGLGEKNRSDIERFIRLVFRRAYGARIRHFLPYLLSMHRNRKMLAALGIRPALEGNLFLEAYLDTPIENTLALHLKRPIDRSRIVEVGNLSSDHGGGARVLIITLTAYLFGAGYEWAVFTATPSVRNNFAKLNAELLPLANADKSRLGAAQSDWGNYYEQGPVVLAGNIVQGANIIRAGLEDKSPFPTAQQLWDKALLAGRLGRLRQPPPIISAQWPWWALHDDVDFSV